MRGKPQGLRGSLRLLRNIPAYAGKTTSSRLLSSSCQEHPRVCGENISISVPEASWPGTSPRMRGKRLGQRVIFGKKRNIPAYAGKTNQHQTCLPNDPEHPRVCGENKVREFLAQNDAGTSPRMRGKPAELGKLNQYGGNIPAYAGKTTGPPPQPTWPWEHPRVCGENSGVKLR